MAESTNESNRIVVERNDQHKRAAPTRRKKKSSILIETMSKLLQKGQPGVLAVTLPLSSSSSSSSSSTSATSMVDGGPTKPRIPMPKPVMRAVAAPAGKDKTAKKHIFSIPGPNAVVDFAALQQRRRPKKPNKLKLGILHDRVEHYSDPARADDAIDRIDAAAEARRTALVAVDQDLVTAHARVSEAQCAIALALRPFASFLALHEPSSVVVAGDERFLATRPLAVAFDATLVAYRKHRKVLRKLLDSRSRDASSSSLEPFDVTREVVSIQTPPVCESIDDMCAARAVFSTDGVAWHVRLFDAYEPLIARFSAALRSAINRAPDHVLVAVTADELAALRDALNELERAYVAYARHAVVFDRNIAELGKLPAQRDQLAERERRSTLALHNSQAKLDQRLMVLKTAAVATAAEPVDNVRDDSDDDNDNDNDNDDENVSIQDETPPLPEDFKALELALKSDSVVAFYRKLQRFPAVEPAPRASYMTIEPTEELVSAVVAILHKLDHLQVRGKKSGAPRAKRLDIGMHATRKRLEARSAIAIVLATDIEPVPTLLNEIAALQALAHKRGRVPVMCMMTRRELATALNRQNDAGEKMVSVVTISSVTGAEREFRALRALWVRVRDKHIREQREQDKSESEA
jgi:ribosomal protein L7Ae-like RNA K-turn-binding protein